MPAAVRSPISHRKLDSRLRVRGCVVSRNMLTTVIVVVVIIVVVIVLLQFLR
jgi:hypothetical protein